MHLRRIDQASRTRFREWFFQGIRQPVEGPHAAADPPGAMVESDVPHRRRLLLDARISAGHRVSRGRRARARRDVDSRHPHARGRAAGLQQSRGREPERSGQHLDARRSAAALAGQGVRPRAARVRGDGFRHHHHPVGSRRDRARHPQPVRARRVRSPGRRHDRAADGARRGLPEGIPRSDRPRRGDRGGVSRVERRRPRRRHPRAARASRVSAALDERALYAARQSDGDAARRVSALSEARARACRGSKPASR